jgi:tetratricopeptide (TPR) repeat protein
MATLMGKKTLLLELFLRSILPPFYSFSMVERVCKKKLNFRPSDKDILWVLSNLYYSYKEFQKARFHLEILQKIGVSTKGVKLLLSRVYYNLGIYGKVKAILTEQPVLSDKDKENYYLADSLIQLKEFDSAVKYLSTYLENNKKNYEPFVKLGYVFYMQGLYDRALNAYKTAEKIHPNDTEIKKSIELCKGKIGTGPSLDY